MIHNWFNEDLDRILAELLSEQAKFIRDNTFVGTQYTETVPRPSSKYWNEKTIQGEVVENDGEPERANFFPYISYRRRHIPEHTVFTGGECRCSICRWAYGRPKGSYQGKPRFSVISEAREAVLGKRSRIGSSGLHQDIGGYRFQDRDFSADYYRDYRGYFEFRIVPDRNGHNILRDINP